MRQAPPDPEEIARDVFDRFINRKVIVNVFRASHVEAMVLRSLGPDYRCTDGWQGWDLEHCATRWKLEVKQAAAIQTWKQSGGSFVATYDIAPRKWTFEKRWIEHESPKRIADAYLFAWHGRTDDGCDQRDATQWEFLVLPAARLPEGQKSIARSSLTKLGNWLRWEQISAEVERVRSGLSSAS